jgi:hypothetical protein
MQCKPKNDKKENTTFFPTNFPFPQGIVLVGFDSSSQLCNRLVNPVYSQHGYI